MNDGMRVLVVTGVIEKGCLRRWTQTNPWPFLKDSGSLWVCCHLVAHRSQCHGTRRLGKRCHRVVPADCNWYIGDHDDWSVVYTWYGMAPQRMFNILLLKVGTLPEGDDASTRSGI